MQFGNLAGVFTRGSSLTYNLCYIALIYFFSYFWMAITFNPKEISENLKDFGTFIPGYRPGRRTAEYLEKVMVRITYVGAAFLAIVAIVPTVISGLDARAAEHRQLLRRHGPADCSQRGLRPDSENRQPPRDAGLSGTFGTVVQSTVRLR